MSELPRPDLAERTTKLHSLRLVFAALVLVTTLSLALLYLALAAQSAVRGYVAGESTWSKAQVDAVLMLHLYGKTKDPKYFEQYKTAIEIPLIDRLVRIEMQKPDFDYEVAERGMLRGKVDPREIPGMIYLFRCCGDFPAMQPVIAFWEKADPHILRLDQLAQELHAAVSLERGGRSIDRILSEVTAQNEAIRPLAAGFNASLGGAARSVTHLLFVSTSGLIIGLVALGALISARTLTSLRRSEAQLRLLLNSAGDGVMVICRNSRNVLEANPRAAQIAAVPAEAILSMPYDELFEPADPGQASDAPQALPQHVTVRNRSGEQTVEAEVSYSEARWHGKEAYLCIVRDVSERLANERALQLANKALANLVEGVMILNHRFEVVSVNRAYTKITGYKESEVVGKLPPLPRTRQADVALYREVRQRLRTVGMWRGEILNQRKSGQYYSELHRISCVHDSRGVISHYVCVFDDNTAVRDGERQLRFLAQHDPLTKLLNRSKFEELARESVEEARRTGGKTALLFVDLDNFKTINDTFGHLAGDRYLSIVSDRIRGVLRSTDVIGRIGGDEFAVLLPDIRTRADVKTVAAKLREAIAKQFQHKEHELSGSASVGLCIFPDDATNVEDLFIHADMAMYEAKKRGRNTAQWFTSEMKATIQSKLMLASGLRVAAERGQLEVHYQPYLDMRTHKPQGLEALLRWTHPELGRVSPAVFIPLAEEFGVIDQLTEFVLNEVCRQGRAWQDDGLPPVQIAVNLSPRSFWDADLCAHVGAALERSGWGAQYLRLEITESTIMGGQDPEKVMMQLRELGVTLSIDDFGIGYSSLGSLQKFPVNCLKIDMSFVRDIPQNQTNLAITKTIISLAKNLGLELVAEGIETQQQADTLLDAGCTHGQGYLFAKPAPAAQIETLLRSAARPKLGAA